MQTHGRRNVSGTWDSRSYDRYFSYVSRMAEGLIRILAPLKDERILDMGCGTGDLTAKIARSGARVIGLDISEDMIVASRRKYPTLDFQVGDVKDFKFEEPFDAVFSNAVLHWIDDQAKVIDRVRQILKIGGRFITEMGGKGNIATIETAIHNARLDLGYPEMNNPWHFGNPADYSRLLKDHGFRITHLAYFNRPTPLEGEDGVKKWIEMFGSCFLADIKKEDLLRFWKLIDDYTRPTLYRDGIWIADYKRLRFAAMKESE